MSSVASASVFTNVDSHMGRIEVLNVMRGEPDGVRCADTSVGAAGTSAWRHKGAARIMWRTLQRAGVNPKTETQKMSTLALERKSAGEKRTGKISTRFSEAGSGADEVL